MQIMQGTKRVSGVSKSTSILKHKRILASGMVGIELLLYDELVVHCLPCHRCRTAHFVVQASRPSILRLMHASTFSRLKNEEDS